MKKHIISCLIAGLISTALVFAQETTATDAVFRNLVKEYTLNSDGSWDYHYSHTLQIHTYYAFHSLYGEDFIVYNPNYQKLTINKSVTTMADATKVPGPQNAFNELLPSFAVNAPAFNHLREMAVTHTGLERGAIIDFDYTLHSSKEHAYAFAGNEVFMMSSPVESLTFILRVPGGVNLSYVQYNFDAKPVITKEGNRTTYQWVLKNLPASSREDFRPKDLSGRPRIVFSATKNAGKVFQAFSSQKSFTLAIDGKLKYRTEGLKKENKPQLQTMLAVQDIVANEINYHPVPLSYAAFRVRTATEVFESNGGSEAEKAVLMASMLKALDIPAEVVAVLPERFFDAKTSNLMQVERFLVKALPGSSDPFYLSPLQTDTYDQVNTLGGKKLALIRAAETPEWIKEKPLIAELETAGSLLLDETMQIKGNLNLTLTGRFNPYLKMTQDSSYIKKLTAGAFSSAEIKSSALNRFDRDMLKAEFTVNSSSNVKELAEHFMMEIPELNYGVKDWRMTELVSIRTEPLILPFPVSESYRFSITLPEGMELITQEQNLTVQKGYGKIQIRIQQDGRTVDIVKSLSLNSTEISLQEYEDFRSFINTWNNKKYKELVIRKGPK